MTAIAWAIIGGLLIGYVIGHAIGYIKAIKYCTKELENNLIKPLQEKYK